jgi:hypothetical protein
MFMLLAQKLARVKPHDHLLILPFAELGGGRVSSNFLLLVGVGGFHEVALTGHGNILNV